MVDIIYYAKTEEKTARRLLNCLSKNFRLTQKNSFSCVEKFQQRMGEPLPGMPIVVLMIEEDEIPLVLKVRNRLANTRLLIVLSQWHQKSILRLNCLSPRYITYASANFDDLMDVIRNIIAKA